MPDYHRVRVEGGTYFFTVVTHLRRPILTSTHARGILHDAWANVKERFPFETVAICLLPDHLHSIWRLPEGDADYSMRWKEIKRLFSRRYLAEIGPGEELSPSRQKRGEAAIWQRRFWEHTICDEGDLEEHLDYIHYNPVKHGYVKRPANWAYSSFARYVKEGIYDINWAGGDEGRIQKLDWEKIFIFGAFLTHPTHCGLSPAGNIVYNEPRLYDRILMINRSIQSQLKMMRG